MAVAISRDILISRKLDQKQKIFKLINSFNRALSTAYDAMSPLRRASQKASDKMGFSKDAVKNLSPYTD